MQALLDVNVLIALLDVDHMHHEAARHWLRDNVRNGWATCPITEIGCVRVMAQPVYPNSRSASHVAERLRDALATDHHQFWPDDVSLMRPGVVNWRRIVGPRQITDIYLLALAVARGGRFVTFDARIDPDTVIGVGPRSYCVI